MTTSSIVISVNYGAGDVTRFVKDVTDPRGQCQAIKKMFEKFASGSANGSFTISTATAAAVRASGTLTLTYASITNLDTVVIGGITLTAVTGTPSGYTQFKKETDATKTAANCAAAINGLTTLNIYVSATSKLGVVTVTANQAGVIGNLITLVGSTGIVASAAVLASGAGGATTAAKSYSRGL